MDDPATTLSGMAEIFIADGASSELAHKAVQVLIERHGLDVCWLQLEQFPAHYEEVRRRELPFRNPSGLLAASIQHNYAAPTTEGQASW